MKTAPRLTFLHDSGFLGALRLPVRVLEDSHTHLNMKSVSISDRKILLIGGGERV